METISLNRPFTIYAVLLWIIVQEINHTRLNHIIYTACILSKLATKRYIANYLAFWVPKYKKIYTRCALDLRETVNDSVK